MAFTISEVSICNQALAEIGENAIANLSENTKQAKYCNAIFNNFRRELLYMTPWRFALEEVECARSVDTPILDYLYKYKIPSDSIRLWKVDSDNDYKVRQGNILTDNESCKIIYVKDQSDVSTWSPDFVAAFVSGLVYKIIWPISQSNTAQEKAYKVFLKVLQSAKTQNSQLDILDRISNFSGDLISSRY